MDLWNELWYSRTWVKVKCYRLIRTLLNVIMLSSKQNDTIKRILMSVFGLLMNGLYISCQRCLRWCKICIYWPTDSLTDWFSHWLTHSLTHLFTDSRLHLLAPSLRHSLMYWCIYALTHSCTKSLILLLTHSLNQLIKCIISQAKTYTNSLMHSPSH